jgi:hypothetical protein
MMAPKSLPPIPPPLETPRIVPLPIQPHDPRNISTDRVSMVQQRRIGAVVVTWAKLENSINDLIWTIDGKDLASGRFATQDFDITKLLSALQRAISTNLPGPSLQNERRAITDIINIVNEAKSDRNAVVHGTSGELNGSAVAGSLRFEMTNADQVSFQEFTPNRMLALIQIAIDATKNCYAMIYRLEALQQKSAPPSPTGETNHHE